MKLTPDSSKVIIYKLLFLNQKTYSETVCSLAINVLKFVKCEAKACSLGKNGLILVN